MPNGHIHAKMASCKGEHDIQMKTQSATANCVPVPPPRDLGET